MVRARERYRAAEFEPECQLFLQSQPSINAPSLLLPLTPRGPATELVVPDGPESVVAMSNKIVVSCSPKTCLS